MCIFVKREFRAPLEEEKREGADGCSVTPSASPETQRSVAGRRHPEISQFIGTSE